jgi:hypothetical protein
MTIKPENIHNKGAMESLDPDSPQNKGIKSRERSLMRDSMRAIVAGWVKPNDPAWAKILSTVDRVMDSDDDRAARAAAALRVEMFKVAQAFLDSDDKIDRLDTGQATENMGIKIIYEQDNGD